MLSEVGVLSKGSGRVVSRSCSLWVRPKHFTTARTRRPGALPGEDPEKILQHLSVHSVFSKVKGSSEVLFAFGLTVLFFLLAHGVWWLGLRSYSGAST
jgi:hypothetical protein